MHEIVLSVINTGSFELSDILHKIDALWLNWRHQSLTLLSYSYCITGIPKPADT